MERVFLVSLALRELSSKGEFRGERSQSLVVDAISQNPLRIFIRPVIQLMNEVIRI